MQVLNQVSPKITEVVCKTARDNPDRNRTDQYLPCKQSLHILPALLAIW